MDDRDQNADQVFMDALLERVHDADRETRAERVDGALDRIRREHWAPAVGPRASVRRIGWTLLSATAAAVWAATVLLGSGPDADAAEAVERSIEAMTAPVDRHYAFVIEAGSGGEDPALTGDLYLRGDAELAVRLEREGGTTWIGEDASGSWVVPPQPLMPVLTGPRGTIFAAVFRTEDTSLPALRLATALGRVRNSYDLAVEDLEGGVREITAQLVSRPESAARPSWIRFRADAGGVIQRLETRWTHYPGVGHRAVTLQLLDARTQDADFYGHAAHHDGRPVVERTEDR
ncbi:MAG: hypothetical protein AAFR54_00445 [Planctomycetota bacterium]